MLSRLAATVLLTSLAGALPVSGQRIHGAALDAEGAPVVDVAVEVSSADGTALPSVRTDSAGLFLLTLPGPGRYELSASRLGYTAIGPVEIVAERGRDLEVILRMSTEALVLNPVEVTVRRAAQRHIDEVRNRIDFVRRLGFGHTLTRDEIERRQAPTLAALVASMSPAVRAVAPVTGRDAILMSSPRHDFGVCAPTLYLDGLRATGLSENLYVRPEHLEAVELYPRASLAPVQYPALSDCGVVLFWSRQGDASGPVLTLRRVLLGGAIAAIILFFGLR